METAGHGRQSRAVLAAVWSVAGFIMLYVLFVGTEPGQRLDEAAMQWLSATISSHGWAELVVAWVSAGSLLGLSAVLAVTTALTRGRRVAAIGVLATLAIVAASEVLKLVLARPAFVTDALTNSFPSGHVAVVTGLATALMIAVPPRHRRWVTLVGVAPVVVLTGLATVVLQWHRPSDVVGSVLLSVVVGTLAILLADHRGRPVTEARSEVEAPAPSPDQPRAIGVHCFSAGQPAHCR